LALAFAGGQKLLLLLNKSAIGLKALVQRLRIHTVAITGNPFHQFRLPLRDQRMFKLTRCRQQAQRKGQQQAANGGAGCDKKQHKPG